MHRGEGGRGDNTGSEKLTRPPTTTTAIRFHKTSFVLVLGDLFARETRLVVVHCTFTSSRNPCQAHNRWPIWTRVE